MDIRPTHRRALRTAPLLSLVLGAGLAVPFALPGPADAATTTTTTTTATTTSNTATAGFDTTGRTVVYTAGAGQANEATVTASTAAGSDRITYVIDDVAPIDVTTGCAHPDAADPTRVSCTVTTVESQDPYASLKVNAGDGDDTVTYDNTTGQTYYYAAIDLGAGADRLTDTGSVDGNSVRGGAGDDTIGVGRAAVVLGDDGADTVTAKGGGAVVLGGADNDTLTATGDGSSVSGGDGDDEIRGGAKDQNLAGDAGHDTIRAGAGNDHLDGGEGDDILYGGKGDDTLYGGPGTDELHGGPGTNVIVQD
ncbi:MULTISPECIES: calcium-binding protein [unclassified Streptomyces]|uniref:calcium-binding protein n=1 Tax=unclassified Streptomyces TaxID=2593676 RepID=UPI00278C21ED|nr:MULTISPECIES: calcium-binding protein [unclassified Streptomyces]